MLRHPSIGISVFVNLASLVVAFANCLTCELHMPQFLLRKTIYLIARKSVHTLMRAGVVGQNTHWVHTTTSTSACLHLQTYFLMWKQFPDVFSISYRNVKDKFWITLLKLPYFKKIAFVFWKSNDIYCIFLRHFANEIEWNDTFFIWSTVYICLKFALLINFMYNNNA